MHLHFSNYWFLKHSVPVFLYISCWFQSVFFVNYFFNLKHFTYLSEHGLDTLCQTEGFLKYVKHIEKCRKWHARDAFPSVLPDANIFALCPISLPIKVKHMAKYILFLLLLHPLFMVVSQFCSQATFFNII